MAANFKRGKTEREKRGFDSPAYLEWRQPVEAARRWPAGGSGGGRGGGAAG